MKTEHMNEATTQARKGFAAVSEALSELRKSGSWRNHREAFDAAEAAFRGRPRRSVTTGKIITDNHASHGCPECRL